MASYSKASEERLNERYIRYETSDAFPMMTDFADTRFPFIGAANAGDVALGNWEFDELTEENQYTEEEDMNGRLDFGYPVKIGSNKGTIKVGGRMRMKTKTRDNNFFEFSPESGLETLADVPTEDQTKDDFLAGDKYDAGEFATKEFLGGLNLEDATQFEKEDAPGEYLADNYMASEDVFGGYIMWDQQLSDKFSFLAGVRLEATSIEYTGNELVDGEEFVRELTNTANYTNVLPGVHLRYAATPKTIIRAAWTNTLARPNYYDLVPFYNVADEDEEIFAGNPDLNPTTSMNFDLMGEHYFKSVGLVSGGVFYKDIKRFYLCASNRRC